MSSASIVESTTPETPAASRLRPGDTCWKVVQADRVAFLVDGDAFFGAVAAAIENAQRSVWLVGWDFHSEVRLRRAEAEAAAEAGDASEPLAAKPSEPLAGKPSEPLAGLLDRVVRERRKLWIRVLAWDFAMLYALEREFLPLVQFGARTHRRIRFAIDSAHPVAASQHQKLVVVDDRVAFVGGFDLTAHRWDTREHRSEHPLRVTPAGDPYGPFHDVQVMLSGAAAAAVGELARDRWERATGQRIAAAHSSADPWPDLVEPALRDVPIGISRTFPCYGERPEILEVEALYRTTIESAQRWIFIENQYLTAARVADWLARRLREPEGPEVLIIGPRRNSGWLEENTMGALRDRAIRQLRAADTHGRLRVLYPHSETLPEDAMIYVHSKVMVVDDTFMRIGSANLSNRSLGLDSECDIALDAHETEGDARETLRRAIARFRDDLLAEHLGTEPEVLARELERTGSLLQAVDALNGSSQRCLRPQELEADDWTADAIEALGTVDPEHPVPLEELITRFETSQTLTAAAPLRGRSWLGILGSILVVTLLALAWQLTPLKEWLASAELAAALGTLQQAWYGPIAATALFTLACLLLVPVSALTAATGLALGPVTAISVAWLGSIAAAALGHLAGRLLWRDTVRRLAGKRLHSLSQRLARRGILSSALLRMVPIAPFMVVNLVAGASHVRARDFVAGTALGMLPGIVVLVAAAEGLRALIVDPNGQAWIWAAVAGLGLLVVLIALRRFAARGRPETSSPA